MNTDPQNPTRPNVIVVFTDQQRWDTLGVAGNPSGLTPNLDAMARRGTYFDAAIASNPVCAPSRAAVLTGRYPTETGVWRNGEVLDPAIPTIATAFRNGGYRTGYIGKWHLADENPVPREQRPGFESWLGSNLLEFTSDAYRTVVFDDDGDPIELPGYRADALVDAAIRFVTEASQDDRPFLLFLSLMEPHHQNELDDYPAPEVYRDAFADAWTPPDLVALGGTTAAHLPGYYGQVKRIDEAVGRLRDALISLELDESTITAYTSDHGSHFKTRNAEYKRSAHDASVRVPLLIDGPGIVPGRRVAEPVTTAALTPTLVRAAGLDPIAGTLAAIPVLATHLAEAATAENSGDEGVLVQISESETGRALRTRRWTYHVEAEGLAARSPGYHETGLWDLRSDPYQLENLIDFRSHEGVAAELRQALIERIAEIEGVEVRITPRDRREVAPRAPETVVRSSGLRGRLITGPGGRRPLDESTTGPDHRQ